MSTFSTLVLALTMTLPADAQRVRDPHIRSSEPELLAALADGANSSATMKQLVDQLNTLDIVLYLRFGRSVSPEFAGHIALLASTHGRRYLRITIDRAVAGRQRIALLGHELHHALEIAESTAVTDDAALAAFYQRIGFRNRGVAADCFDTAGAILAGRIIEKELRAAGHVGTR